MNLEKFIHSFPDFPSAGILFRDVSPVLSSPEALNFACEALIDGVDLNEIDAFVGIESRGFPFAAILAAKHNKSMVMVRKAGKLPGKTEKLEYEIEYGQAVMEIQHAIIKPGQRVFICDDLLATGGTASAAAQLIEKVGGQVIGLGFVIELVDLHGYKKIASYPYKALIRYE